jgi:drug/metabolite transporter (DMT)-like permease
MPEFAAAVLAVLLMATTQLLFKSAARREGGVGATFLSAPVLAGLAINVVAAGCWVFALRRLELSYAFPLLSLNFLLVPIAAWRMFGEPLSARRLGAIAVIVLGVALCVAAG